MLSWRHHPYSSKSLIPRASSLDCEVTESLGLLRIPPMARALNVLSLLKAHQADPDLVEWEEIPIITDLCVRVQRCAVRDMGKTLGTMVL